MNKYGFLSILSVLVVGIAGSQVLFNTSTNSASNVLNLSFSFNNQQITSCPNILSSPTRAQILTLISDTKYKNPECALAALSSYGQTIINTYNINVNLTNLKSSLPKVSPNEDVKINTVAEGRISNVTGVVTNLEKEYNLSFSTSTTSSNTTAMSILSKSKSLTGTSKNWAGYVVDNSSAKITDVVGTWVVQTANANSLPTYSSQWEGIGGWVDGTLVQDGTESDYNGGASYYGWYEYDPNNITQQKYCNILCTFTISPGDKMIGEVFLVPGTTNQWNFTLIDFSTGVGYFVVKSLSASQAPSRKTAEWIDERTTESGSLPYLTKFGTAYYGPSYSAGYNYAGINSLFSKNIGAWPTVISVSMYSNSPSDLLAYPSALGSDKQSFTVTRTPNMTK